MSVNEQGLTLVLAAGLVGLAGYFGWQQLRTLRGLTSPEVLGAGDRRYLRTQAYRRICCSILMVIFAGLLIGWLFLDANNRQLREERLTAQALDPTAPAPEEQKEFVRFLGVYWVVALLVLLALLALAASDFWATARFALSQHRKLQADHRALLQEQMDRRRQERNGQQHQD